MKKIPFKKARFLTSALKKEELLHLPLPQIALVGRSNVGKSSLINHLLATKNLAKTSSTPGKTQRINYFLVDESLLLVDLPGYGYAKTSQLLRKEWGKWIDTFLREKSFLLILFLLDSRREVQESDLQFIAWAEQMGKPIFTLFTKEDKLPQKEREGLFAALGGRKDVLPYSIKLGKRREQLIAIINRALWEH